MATRRRGQVLAAASVTLAGAGLLFSPNAPTASARPDSQVFQVEPDVDQSSTTNSATAVGDILGSRPSVSGDGRFVVFEGADAATADAVAADDADGDEEAPATRSTIYLTDRAEGTTTELTAVPSGLRAGNSIRPVISGDGCSVVMVTELALDVFLDDDGGDRWDVYRLVLPHCDGTPGNWELVSTTNTAPRLARDDVDPNQTPAVSRSGTDIAYVHPDERLFDAPDVTTVSVVDLTVPPSDPARTQVVAGMPTDRPNTTFVHTGIDQPAISDDGNHVAYRSDAFSAEAVPVWGTGSVDGEAATKQVFVWDRLEADPFAAVQLVSKSASGEPSLAGAAEPDLSRDGSVVAFTSADTGLVEAVYPTCETECPTQVYRFDRDTDDDEVFDEDSATTLSVMSIEAQAALTGDPIVGTGPSSQPVVSADGELVVFVSTAANLQLIEAPGTGEAHDGDILVAITSRPGVRRLTVTEDGVRPAVGAHSNPSISDSGRIAIFDTLAGAELLAEGAQNGRQVVAVSSPPKMSLADADVGTTVVGLESTGWFVGLVNEGPSAFDPATVTVSDSRFKIDAENSTCVIGTLVPAGEDCKVQFTFTPGSTGRVTATLTVAEEGFEAVSITSTLAGDGGEPALQVFPGGADIDGEIVVGESAPEFLFDVSNISFTPTAIDSIELTGANPDDFTVTSNNCADRPLNPRASCAIGVTFTPTGEGRRTALVEVFTNQGQSTSMVLAGDAVYRPELVALDTEVRAGEPFVLGGSDYPANTSLVVTYADGQGRPIELDVVTNEDGDFLVSVPVDPNEAGGARRVVVQSSSGVAAVAPIDVVGDSDESVGLPGFGLGW